MPDCRALPRPHHLLCLALGALPVLAQAGELNVTTFQDRYDGLCDHQCSLRDALAAANRAPGPQLIQLQAGRYVLDRPTPLDAQGVPLDEDGNLYGDLDIQGELIIRGVGGGTQTRIQGQSNDRLIEVLPGATLTLQQLTLEGGNSAHNGGAVDNHGQLLLRRVLVQDNSAMTHPNLGALAETDRYRYGQGGGIANQGRLEVYDSVLQDNRAQGAGGANLGRGGGLFNQGELRVRASTLRRNRVADPDLKGAGGGLYNLGQADIGYSAFLENYGLRFTVGGAIANEAGELNLLNSTLSGHLRGGLSNGYPGNPAQALPKASLAHVTIAGNAGFGVLNWGDLRIGNSLLVGNFDLDDAQPMQGSNCDNRGEHYRYQAVGLLLNDEPSNCRAELFVPFEQTYTHLMKSLFLEGDNGGPTKTYALLPGSPALDAAVGECPALDQRGFPRPQDGTGDGVALCDLGAYELRP